MGEIVNVLESKSSRPGIVRFETNRVLSGTGHDRFRAGEVIIGNRPVDELARRLFARGGIEAVHINSGTVTVDVAKGYTSEGLADIIRSLYTFYDDAPVDAAATEDAAQVAAAEEAQAQIENGHAESAAEPELTAPPAAGS